MFLRGGYGVYRTTDDGTSWTPVNTGSPTDFVRSLVSNQTGTIYRGMESYGQRGGVCSSTDNGGHWTHCSSGLSTKAIYSLAVNTTGILFAATFGGGVYRSTSSHLSPDDTTTSGVDQVRTLAPARNQLMQTYPNPFNPSTTIRYAIPQRSHVTLTVFNTLGQQGATLMNGIQDAGYHEVKFDGTGFSSGVYFYRLQAEDYIESRRLVLLK